MVWGNQTWGRISVLLMYHVIPRMRNANLVNKYGDFGTPSISIERFKVDFIFHRHYYNMYLPPYDKLTTKMDVVRVT